MTNPIINSIASADLNVTELVDAATIRFRATQLSEQINGFRNAYAKAVKLPRKHVLDLSDWIADIIIETTVQGASLLEVHIVDPLWALFQRDTKGTCFIDVDDEGFLWPPIEVTYPPDLSSAVWRLAQVRASTDLTQPNIVLVFEDKIASELREHYGQVQSTPDQTRAEFIQFLIKTASDHPAFPGDAPIRFQHLLPHETFTAADLSMSTSIPQSAKQKHPPPGRKDHHKGVGHPAFPGDPLPTHLQRAMDGIDISIAQALSSITAHVSPGTPYTPATQPNPSEPTVLQVLGGGG